MKVIKLNIKPEAIYKGYLETSTESQGFIPPKKETSVLKVSNP